MNGQSVTPDIKRALTGRGFLIGVIGSVLVAVLSSVESIIMAARSESLMPNGFHARLIMDALILNGFTLVLPILCALPYTTLFVDDMKSGFIKQYLHRSGVQPYIKGKLAACALSGGLVLVCGILLSYGLSALVFTPMEHALGEGEAAQPYFAQLLMKAFILFFSGAFCVFLPS